MGEPLNIFLQNVLPVLVSVGLVVRFIWRDVLKMTKDVKEGFDAVGIKLDALELSIIKINLGLTKNKTEDKHRDYKISEMKKDLDSLKKKP